MVWKHENCTQKQKSWVASYYGCSLSLGEAARISHALHWDKKVILSNLMSCHVMSCHAMSYPLISCHLNASMRCFKHDEPAWPGGKARSAGELKDAGLTPCLGSPFSSKIMIYGHCLATFPCTVNETLKWLTSLPILMRKSFWW